MDKETLSNYGWIVVLVLILAVMLALATPFGTFIAGAIKSTTAGLFSVNQAALGSAGINVDDLVFENCDHLETELRNVTDTYTGDTCCKNCGKVMATGQTVRPKVPEGGTYYVGVTSTEMVNNWTEYTAKYGPGEEFPETITNGDVYVYGDYEYRYNYYVSYISSSSNYTTWSINEEQNGWSARVRNREKTTYGEILTSINGTPVTNLSNTFMFCSKMTATPQIPNQVKVMYRTFCGCSALTASTTIPSSVVDMRETFNSCSSLTASPVIPNGVTSLYRTFSGCTSLTNDGLPIIPSGVTNLEQTFYGCTNLTDVSSLVIPSGVTDLNGTFWSCTSLTNNGMPFIPSTVTQLSQTFAGCTSLTDLSRYEIPDSVTKMRGTFSATGLIDSGMPKLPSKLTDLDSTFANCKKLVNLSTYNIPNTVSNMTSAFMGCTALTTAPDLSNCPTSLNMGLSFYGCTSLTDQGMPKLPSRVNLMGSTFANCTSLVDLSNYTINTGHLSGTFQGCTNLVSAPTINVSAGSWRCENLFSGCTSLTGTITFNGATQSPTYYNTCFTGVDFEAQNITLAGSVSPYLLDTLGNSCGGTNYCAECNGCCKGGH